MLTLLTFPGDEDHPSFSPFCVKAMCLLRMSGRGWMPKYVSNPSSMPYGRLPVLKTSDRLVPDSDGIRAFLESEGAEFDAVLDPAQRAASHALIRMTEENLRCGLVHDRWLRDDCWAVIRASFFSEVPAPLRGIVAGMVRRRIRRAMTAQGMAQFSEEERLDRLGRDLTAIAGTLAGKPFLFGETPTAADAAVVPVIDMIRTLPCDSGLRRLVRENALLMAYIERGRAALYPETREKARGSH